LLELPKQSVESIRSDSEKHEVYVNPVEAAKSFVPLIDSDSEMGDDPNITFVAPNSSDSGNLIEAGGRSERVKWKDFENHSDAPIGEDSGMGFVAPNRSDCANSID
jgi:hypothetical protein